MTKKQKLINEIRKLGFTEEDIIWFVKRKTVIQLQNIIDNCKTHDIIQNICLDR